MHIGYHKLPFGTSSSTKETENNGTCQKARVSSKVSSDYNRLRFRFRFSLTLSRTCLEIWFILYILEFIVIRSVRDMKNSFESSISNKEANNRDALAEYGGRTAPSFKEDSLRKMLTHIWNCQNKNKKKGGEGEGRSLVNTAEWCVHVILWILQQQIYRLRIPEWRKVDAVYVLFALYPSSTHKTHDAQILKHCETPTNNFTNEI